MVEEHLLELLGLEIGDSLTLATSGDYEDALSVDTVTIVGVVISPLYISVERGTSTLGTGQVAAYLYLPREAFDLDYYTALYLTVEGAAEETAFSSEYDDLVDGVVDALEPLGKERAQLRRESLVDEATEKLDDAQAELDDAKAEAEQELSDARRSWLRPGRSWTTAGRSSPTPNGPWRRRLPTRSRSSPMAVRSSPTP